MNYMFRKLQNKPSKLDCNDVKLIESDDFLTISYSNTNQTNCTKSDEQYKEDNAFFSFNTYCLLLMVAISIAVINASVNPLTLLYSYIFMYTGLENTPLNTLIIKTGSQLLLIYLGGRATEVKIQKFAVFTVLFINTYMYLNQEYNSIN